MKVYFDATPSKLDKYQKNYQTIGKAIIELGHQLTSRWLLDFDESFFRMPRDEWVNHYRDIISSLEKADVGVFDISVSSTSVGQLIQQALIWKKPVIALKDHKSAYNIFLDGAGEVESKLILVEYNLENIKAKLKEAFEYVEEWLESRFTLILNTRIRRHLDKVAKTGIARSEYIRKLIEQDIKKKKK
jgi:hypothetical protein